MMERAARIVEALADPSAAPDLELLTRQVRAFNVKPPAVADALVSFVEAEGQRPRRGHLWSMATGLAALFGALGGVMGLQAVTEIFPINPGLANLPVFGLILIALALPLELWRARQRELHERQLVALAVRLCRSGLSGLVAVDLASYVVGLAPEAGRALLALDGAQLEQGLEVRQVTLGAEKRPRPIGALLVSLGTLWVVFGFWVVYFSAIGAGAEAALLVAP